MLHGLPSTAPVAATTLCQAAPLSLDGPVTCHQKRDQACPQLRGELGVALLEQEGTAHLRQGEREVEAGKAGQARWWRHLLTPEMC